MLSSVQDDKSPVDMLDKLGSASVPRTQASPMVGSSSMMDLLDEVGPISSAPGTCHQSIYLVGTIIFSLK